MKPTMFNYSASSIKTAEINVPEKRYSPIFWNPQGGTVTPNIDFEAIQHFLDISEGVRVLPAENPTDMDRYVYPRAGYAYLYYTKLLTGSTCIVLIAPSSKGFHEKFFFTRDNQIGLAEGYAYNYWKRNWFNSYPVLLVPRVFCNRFVRFQNIDEYMNNNIYMYKGNAEDFYALDPRVSPYVREKIQFIKSCGYFDDLDMQKTLAPINGPIGEGLRYIKEFELYKENVVSVRSPDLINQYLRAFKNCKTDIDRVNFILSNRGSHTYIDIDISAPNCKAGSGWDLAANHINAVGLPGDMASLKKVVNEVVEKCRTGEEHWVYKNRNIPIEKNANERSWFDAVKLYGSYNEYENIMERRGCDGFRTADVYKELTYDRLNDVLQFFYNLSGVGDATIYREAL